MNLNDFAFPHSKQPELVSLSWDNALFTISPNAGFMSSGHHDLEELWSRFSISLDIGHHCQIGVNVIV
jgi:hypothetical protein